MTEDRVDSYFYGAMDDRYREYMKEIETCERSMDSDMKPYYKIRNRKSGNTRYPQPTKDDSIHHSIIPISEKEFKQIQANKYDQNLRACEFPQIFIDKYAKHWREV